MNEPEKKKKEFVEPRLTVYGDIREITEAIGKVGAKDGGAMGKTKTR